MGSTSEWVGYLSTALTICGLAILSQALIVGSVALTVWTLSYVSLPISGVLPGSSNT